MVKVRRCAGAAQKQEIFACADPQTDTWVVSDLQSKWHLQKEWLNKNGVLEQDAALRATELWRHFAFQVRPDLQFISSELAQTLIWHWVEPKALPWASTPQAVPVILKQMQMWVSVFADPNYREVIQEWFHANPSAVERWGHWFVLCSELWEWFRERNYVLTPWLPGVLLNEDIARLKWDKKLIFDLGPQISPVEGQLIAQLANHMDITVLYPEGPWVALMPETLRPYDVLLSEPYKGDVAWQPAERSEFRFRRFSTQLAEVKDAVAGVREWLDRGVSINEIAIVAPDIEEYWPALRLYLETEGIPVQKPVAAKLGSFLEMARWLATLRTRLSRLRSADLELSVFAPDKTPRISVAEFQRLFTNVYDEADLKRAEKLFTGARLPSDNSIPVAGFLAWALGHWPASDPTERLEALLKVMSDEVPVGVELPAGEWLNFVEGLLARREFQIEAAAVDGVWAVSLSSAHWLPLTHAVFMNLHDGALRTLERSPVSAHEAQVILQDTGFALGPVERQQMEFELIWFLQKPWRELQLSFSATDFHGQVLTPSRIWMWASFINGQFQGEPVAPRLTRWDEIQRQPVDTRTDEGLKAGLKRDATGELNSFSVTDSFQFSASGLSRLWNCPFTYAIEKVWRLSDDAPVDLDLDRATRGKLLHAILERLTAEPMRFDWSDEELIKVIGECRLAEKIQVGDERLWPAMERQHLKLARMFLTMECEWRERFPGTRTLGRELEVNGFWDIENGGPVRTDTGVKFSGRIDRVDTDSKGRYALIDYKSGSSTLVNWASWLKNFEVQLALYTLLLEEGFTELPAAPVVAANYFVVKDRSRRKGFHTKGEDMELFDPTEDLRNFISDEQKRELFKSLKAEITAALRAIRAGQLNPAPQDKQNCEKCSWRSQCRAPHLN